MKIIFEHLGNKVLLENETAVDITDALDLFEKALIEIGFQQTRIDGAFLWKATAIKDKNETF